MLHSVIGKLRYQQKNLMLQEQTLSLSRIYFVILFKFVSNKEMSNTQISPKIKAF